jgi:putative transposase
LMSGRRLRILTLVYDFARECLALAVDNWLTGLRFTRELNHVATRRGYSRVIISDNGAELTSNAALTGSRSTRSNGTTSRPAAMQNGFVKRFNGRLRDECLKRTPIRQTQWGAADHGGTEDRLQHRQIAPELERPHTH